MNRRMWPVKFRLLALGLIMLFLFGCRGPMGKSRMAFDRGLILEGQNRYSDAIASFRESLQFDPGNQEARFHLAKNLVVTRQLPQALEALGSIPPGNAFADDALLLKVEILADEEIGRFEEAAALCDDLINDPTHQKAALELKGQALAAAWRTSRDPEIFRQSEEVFREAIQSFPEDPRFILALGRLIASRPHVLGRGPNLSIAQEDYRKAQELFEQALTIEPDNREARLGLARLHIIREQLDEALAILEPSVSGESPDSQALVLVAQVALRQYKIHSDSAYLDEAEQAARLDEAEQAARQVLEAYPDNLISRYIVGNIQFVKNHYAEAIPELQQVVLASTEIRRQSGDQQNLVLQNILGDALAKLGRALFMEGQLNQAADNLKQALDNIPEEETDQRVEIHLALAEVYDRMKWPSSTLAECKKALELDPENPEVLRLLGVASLLAGQPQEAGQFFEMALDAAPESVLPYLNLAILAMEEGRLDDALAQCRDAGEAGIRDPRLSCITGICHYRQGQFRSAFDEFRASLQQDPAFRPAKFYLATVALALNRPDLAEREFSELMEGSENPGFLLLLSRARALQGELDEAQKNLQQAIEIEGASPATVLEAQFEMAGLLAARNDIPGAIAYLESMPAPETTDPQTFRLNQRLGNLYALTEDYEKALVRFDASLATDSTSVAALQDRALSLAALKRYREAAEALTTAIQRAPEQSRLYIMRGCVRHMLGNVAGARSDLQEAVAFGTDRQILVPLEALLLYSEKGLEPALAFAEAEPLFSEQDRSQFAEILEAGAASQVDLTPLTLTFFFSVSRWFQAGEQVSRELLNELPDSFLLRLTLADILLRRGKLEETEAIYRELLQQAGRHPVIQLSLGDLYNLLQRPEEAVGVYQAFLESTPNRGDVWTKLGMTFEALGRREEAINAYQRANDLAPNPIAYNNLAWLLAQDEGTREAALAPAKRAVELAPGSASVNDTCGWVLYQLGQVAEATTLLDRAVDLQPLDPTIRYHMGMALAKADRPQDAVFQLEAALGLGLGGEDLAQANSVLNDLQ